MTDLILQYLNTLVSTVGNIERTYCIVERRSGSDGTTMPYEYVGGGNFKPVEVDGGSVSYFRLRAARTLETVDGRTAEKPIQATYPLRFVAMIRRDDNNPEVYSQDVANILTGTNQDLRTILGANRAVITVTSIETDTPKIWQEEFTTPITEPKYSRSMVMIDLTVTVVATRSCWADCADYPDILQMFPWCNPATLERLTPEQLACIEGELCVPLCEQLADVLPEDVVVDVFDCLTLAAQTELLDSECVIPPCADVTQQVNGTTIGTTVSGGTNNQLIRNTAGTAVGTSANPSIVANSTYTLKKSGGTTISTGSIAAEASANITAPDATAVVKDTANNTISTTPIQSDSSANITAPDGTYSLRDTASNVLGTGSIRSGQLAVVITAPDATVTINGASLGATGDIPSGGSEDLDVLQGGVAAGSWNGSAWIIPTCPASPSLAVTLSDDTPNFGDVVLITATPTGITPTSYTFIVPLKDGTLTRTTQAGNTLNWTAVYTGAQKISVEATNGSAWVSDDVDVTVSYVIANGLILNGTNWLSTANGTFNRLLNANIWQMSMWFNATSLANLPIIFAGTASNMFVEVDATHVYVNVGGSLRTYNQVVSTATRYNLVIQKTALGNNLTVYLNGVALTLTSGSSTDLLPLNQGAYIGRYWSGGFELSGKIKDVAFFNSFNSSLAQVTSYYNAGSGSHPVTLGQFPDVWYWLESNPNDYGRLGINATAANSPTYGAF